MPETIRFRNDTLTRKRLMVPESFQHPAKGQLGLTAPRILTPMTQPAAIQQSRWPTPVQRRSLMPCPRPCQDRPQRRRTALPWHQHG